MDVIYLDNNATTHPDPRVVEAVCAAMADVAGNPASGHAEGRRALSAVDLAREQVADVLEVSPSRVLFTAGATESNNIAICGAWRAAREAGSSRRRIIVGATEHPSALEAARSLVAEGADIVELAVTPQGLPDMRALEALIDDTTLLVSLLGANNETGVLTAVRQAADTAHASGALFHSDITQMMGRVPVDVYALGLDLASISGHKFHGPKGVGALFVDTGVPVVGVYLGGGQEKGLRPGTLNVPGIVGLGQACARVDEFIGRSAHVEYLRELLVASIQRGYSPVTVNGDGSPRLPNTANIRLAGVDGDALVASTPSVAFSTGSACSSAAPSPSHVLTAMGLTESEASECVRFSLSVHTTDADVVHACEAILESARRLRGLASEGAA